MIVACFVATYSPAGAGRLLPVQSGKRQRPTLADYNQHGVAHSGRRSPRSPTPALLLGLIVTLAVVASYGTGAILDVTGGG